MTEIIPFNKPYMAGKELYYIAQSELSGHTSGDGEFSKKCQTLFKLTFQAKNIACNFMHLNTRNDGAL